VITDPLRIVAVLERHRVRYVAVGMFAAVVQGAIHDTDDIDITPEASLENLRRLADALGELHARFRIEEYPDGFAPPGGIDERTFTAMTSVAFVTNAGNLDVVMLPDGTRGYPDLIRAAHHEQLADDMTICVASVEDIIRSKQAADRIKDRAVLPALRQLAERLHRDN